MTLQVESPTVYTSQGVPISVTGIAQVNKEYTFFFFFFFIINKFNELKTLKKLKIIKLTLNYFL